MFHRHWITFAAVFAAAWLGFLAGDKRTDAPQAPAPDATWHAPLIGGHQLLRVPLDADQKTLRIGGLGGLDHPVRAACRDAEVHARHIDRLMVPGIHLEFRLAENPLQAGALLKRDLVGGPAMIAAFLARDVLHQRPAMEHVDPLAAQADPEQRLAGVLDPRLAQGLLKAQAIFVEQLHGRVLRFAILGGRDVGPARH